jgi:hypothetical protein
LTVESRGEGRVVEEGFTLKQAAIGKWATPDGGSQFAQHETQELVVHLVHAEIQNPSFMPRNQSGMP